MADETLIIEVKADTTGLIPTIDLLEKLGKIDAATAAQFRKASTDIQAQQKALQGVGVEAKKAGDETEKAGKKISDSAKKSNKDLTDLSGTVKGIGQSIGIGLGTAALLAFGKEAANLSAQFTSIRNALNFVQGSVEKGGEAFDFITNLSKELGLELISTATAFKLFSASAQLGGLTAEKTKSIFRSVAGATTALGLSAQDTQGVFLALSQIISKGTVQAEELRGQIGERLPGAFELAAKSMGITTKELNKLLQNGQVLAKDFLPAFADQLDKTFASALPQAVNAANANINRLTNLFTTLKVAIGDAVNEFVLSPLAEGLFPKFLSNAEKFVSDLKQKNIDTINALSVPELLAKLNEVQKARENILSQPRDETAVLALENLKKQENLIRSIIGQKEKAVAADAKDFETLQKLKLQLEGLKLQQLTLADPLGDGREQNQKLLNEIEDVQKKIDEITGKADKKRKKKEVDETHKIREELRQFTLKSLLDEIDEKEAAFKAQAAREITNTEQLQGRLKIIEFQALQERKLAKKEFGASSIEEEKKITEILIKNTEEFNKAIEKANEDAQDRRLKSVKDLSKSIDEVGKAEGDLSKKSFSELFLIIKIGKEAGLKGLEDVKAAQEEVLKRFVAIIESIAQIGQEITGILNAQDEQRLQSIEAQKEAIEGQFDAESEALETKLDRDIITQAAYEKQLKALKDKQVADQKRLDEEAKAIKRQQAQREKDFNIFETIINTARAVTAALPNLFLSALAGVIGGLQLAKIISTPIPQFAKGVEVLKGKGTATSDSIPAMLSVGEGVMPADINKEYRAALSAIYNRKVPASLINNFVRMKLDAMPASKVNVSSAMPDFIDYHGMRDVMKRGVPVTNVDELAQAIVKYLPKESPSYRI